MSEIELAELAPEVETEQEDNIAANVESESDNAESATAKEDHGDDAAESKVQKRINKITRDKYEEKQRADRLERELLELKAMQQQAQVATKPPALADFDYDQDAYNAAMIDYRVQQSLDARLKAQQRDVEQSVKQQQHQQAQVAFNQKLESFVKAKPDYFDVVKQLPTLPDDLVNAVITHDRAPEIAYYLGKHLDIADEIAQLSPVRAAMKLGEITAMLSNSKTVKPSSAPEPISTVTSGGKIRHDIGDANIPISEWMKQFN